MSRTKTRRSQRLQLVTRGLQTQHDLPRRKAERGRLRYPPRMLLRMLATHGRRCRRGRRQHRRAPRHAPQGRCAPTQIQTLKPALPRLVNPTCRRAHGHRRHRQPLGCALRRHPDHEQLESAPQSPLPHRPLHHIRPRLRRRGAGAAARRRRWRAAAACRSSQRPCGGRPLRLRRCGCHRTMWTRTTSAPATHPPARRPAACAPRCLGSRAFRCRLRLLSLLSLRERGRSSMRRARRCTGPSLHRAGVPRRESRLRLS